MAQWSALLLLFYVCPGALGVEVVVGSSSVNLPVALDPGRGLSSVLWTRGSEEEEEEVHQKVSHGDDLRDQSRLFKGRTQMKPDARQTGDLSLQLSYPTLTDQGNYTCKAREGDKEGSREDKRTVELRVRGAEASGTLGSPVALPFQVGAVGDTARVRWSWGSEEVHLRVGNEDDLSAQSSHFSGLTHMKPDALKSGDLGLVLKEARESESGLYTCVVTEGATELARTTVLLSLQEPVVFGALGITLSVVSGIVVLVSLVLTALTCNRKKQTNESFINALIGLITCRTPML